MSQGVVQLNFASNFWLIVFNLGFQLKQKSYFCANLYQIFFVIFFGEILK